MTYYRYRARFCGLVPVYLESLGTDASIHPRHWSLLFPLLVVMLAWIPLNHVAHRLWGIPLGSAPFSHVTVLLEPVAIEHDD